LKIKILLSTLDNALAFLNAGAVVANTKVVGLAPGTDVKIFKNIFAKKLAKNRRVSFYSKQS
jgi:hypothetical protein